MRLDYMVTVWNHGNRRVLADVLDEVREGVQAAEQAGFETAWMGEHHFQSEGFDVLPNPILLAADLATRTSRIKLGVGAVGVPAWHPLRLTEDLSMLDQLSRGRFEIAFGRGISPRDVRPFNPAADRADADRSLALFLEYLDVIKRAWTEEDFTYKGEFVSYPPEGMRNTAISWFPRDPKVVDENSMQISLPVYPRPYQQPHPPLFTVTERLGGMVMAAEQDLRPVTWLHGGKDLDEMFEAYTSARSAKVGRQLGRAEDCGLMRPCIIADSFEEAREAGKAGIETMGKAIGAIRGRGAFADKGEELSEFDVSSDWFDFLHSRDHIIAGTPESVIETISRLREQHGVEHLWLWMNPYGVEHPAMMRSIELFGEHVAPAFAQTSVVG